MALEAKHNVSQAGIDSILQSTETLIQHHLTEYKSNIKKELIGHRRGTDPAVFDSIPIETFVEPLNSATRRHEYYKKNMPYVEPVQILLGPEKKLSKGVSIDSLAIGYCIPFRDTIQHLLKLPDV